MTRLEELSASFLAGLITAREYRSSIIPHINPKQIKIISSIETDEETRLFAINHVHSEQVK